MTTLRSWYAEGRWVLVTRLTGVGAVAGVAAWVLALALSSLLGVPRPGVQELLLAVPRGALIGALLAFALGTYWEWRGREGTT